MSVRVEFVERQYGPERLVCEAELVFEGEEFGPLQGMKLVGFMVWRGADEEQELYVTFPSRAIGVGAERRFFDYLRSTALDNRLEVVKQLKGWMLDQWRRKGQEQQEQQAG